MKFGLAYEMQRPELDDHAVIEETIAQVCLADEMGFDYVWFVEHHFLTTFSMSPCPEVIFGALSRLTKRIRLGFGVVILPYHHPVRVAERVAMVDHLTNGRVDLGTGRSAPYEQTGMGIDPRDTRAMWEESLRMIPRIWADDYFQWDGQFWQVPPRQVLPKPYQQPHPPIWVAALQPATYELAAQRGIGVMALGVSAPSILEPHIAAYRENIKNAQPVGQFVNNQWLSSVFGLCGPDNAATRQLCADSLKTFFGPGRPYVQDQKDVYSRLLQQWGGIPEHLQQNFSRYIDVPSGAEASGAAASDTTSGAASGSASGAAASGAASGNGNGNTPATAAAPAGAVDLSGGTALAQKIWEEFDADTLADRGVIVAGDPDSCIRAAKLHQATGVDQLQFLMATETVPHDKVMESIALFGKHVLPHFR